MNPDHDTADRDTADEDTASDYRPTDADDEPTPVQILDEDGDP